MTSQRAKAFIGTKYKSYTIDDVGFVKGQWAYLEEVS